MIFPLELQMLKLTKITFPCANGFLNNLKACFWLDRYQGKQHPEHGSFYNRGYFVTMNICDVILTPAIYTHHYFNGPDEGSKLVSSMDGYRLLKMMTIIVSLIPGYLDVAAKIDCYVEVYKYYLKRDIPTTNLMIVCNYQHILGVSKICSLLIPYYIETSLILVGLNVILAAYHFSMLSEPNYKLAWKPVEYH